MNVITTFQDRQLQKQMMFERKVLKELSLNRLKDTVRKHFSPFFYSNTIFTTAIEEGSIDLALEAYLLGANMSKFGYFGESLNDVKNRCEIEEKFLIDGLFDYMQYWGAASGHDLEMDSLYIACELYIDEWWKEGFQKGERRYKLRLH